MFSRLRQNFIIIFYCLAIVWTYILIGFSVTFGWLLISSFHELGHAFAAVIDDSLVSFVFQNGNPAVVVSSTEKDSLFVGISRFILNILIFPVVSPLLHTSWPLYLILCLLLSSGDFLTILRIISEP